MRQSKWINITNIFKLFWSKNNKSSAFMKHIHCVRMLLQPLSINMKKRQCNFAVRSTNTVCSVHLSLIHFTCFFNPNVIHNFLSNFQNFVIQMIMHMIYSQRNHNFISKENDFIQVHCGSSMFYHTKMSLLMGAAAAQWSHGENVTITATSLHYLWCCCLSSNELKCRTSTRDQSNILCRPE